MAVDMFLKIDGIEGESANAKHKGEIDIESYSMAAHQTGTFATGGGGGAGKASFSDITVVKKVDKSSPKLFEACATGKHIKSVVISVNKAGGQQEEYIKYTLSDVLISGFQGSGSESSDSVPTESISFNFAKIEMEYKEQKSAGSTGGAVKAGYDIKANKKV
ncbi:Hcp family type VI secretion system effector [Tundrisphaera sp. TA3]|uniref:Hcp family type VI secretion system effector n=1 Tax=Tundrisphaera sp. TA3 TaxID=3435775 RepID=UPI003EBF396A